MGVEAKYVYTVTCDGCKKVFPFSDEKARRFHRALMDLGSRALMEHLAVASSVAEGWTLTKESRLHACIEHGDQCRGEQCCCKSSHNITREETGVRCPSCTEKTNG
jgi:hypothetical protein